MKEKMMSQADADMPSNSSIRLTLWVAMAGLVIMTTWAGMTEIDQVKRAQGQVIASDRTQVIQAVDGGVLRELLVQEGDEVQSGQLLASFEKTRVRAALDDTQGKVMALRITLAPRRLASRKRVRRVSTRFLVWLSMTKSTSTPISSWEPPRRSSPSLMGSAPSWLIQVGALE